MAHKTLIGGTAYEISGGKALVDATAYEIDKGKALIGGTAYEVGFAKPMVNVTLVADLPNNYSSIQFEISHNTYGNISSAGTYELEIGTELTFSIRLDGKTCEIYLNYDKATGHYEEILATDSESFSYAYALNGSVSIEAIATPMGGVIYITEE